MQQEWLEFQTLVARIEDWLAPRGAVIKSPDIITDKRTGQKREVDASIRFQLGSVPILVVMECRKHKKTQDVTWVEQAATKRDSVGAARMILVSSTGFYRPAIELAEQLGIELREVKDVTQHEAAQWAHKTSITLYCIRWKNIGLTVHCHSDAKLEGVELVSRIRDGFLSGDRDAEIAFHKKEKQPLTIRMIVNDADRIGFDIKEGIEVGGPPVRKTLPLQCPKSLYCVETNKGWLDVERIDLTLDVALTREVAPPPKVVQYRTPEADLIQVAEVHVPLGGDKGMTIMYSTQPPGDFEEENKTNANAGEEGGQS